MAALPSKAFAAFARRFPVIQAIPVAWGDMDAFQHVNNVQYYRYFESARLAHMLEMFKAVPPSDPFDCRGFLEATAIGPILGSSSCVFKLPVKYPDVVFAGSYVVGASAADSSHPAAPTEARDRFVMEYALFSVKADRIAATGEASIVLFDYRAKRKASGTPPGLLHAMREVNEQAPRRSDEDIARLAAIAPALLPTPLLH